ncbi:MAG: hypothetical protein ACJ8HI_00260 [Massilia sp.]
MQVPYRSVQRGLTSNRAAFYLNRIVTARPARAVLVAAIRRYIAWRQRDRVLQAAPAQQAAVEGLNAEGYTELGQLLSRDACQEIVDYLSNKKMQDRDIARAPYCLADAPESARLADFSLADTLKCPHILGLANSPLLLGMATQYIGCKPTLSSVVIRWSFPAEAGRSDLQRFHRDTDDWRFFKVMVYLTDVDEACGPHVYVKATHRDRQTIRQRFWRDEEIAEKYGDERLAVALGPKGTAFAVDTAGIHKGQAPERGRRLMLMLQYSLLPCYSVRKEPVEAPLPAGLDAYINRVLFAPAKDTVVAQRVRRRVLRS